MELSRTQAGETQKTVDEASQGLLEMTGQVGQKSNDLAEAYYHAASAGLGLQKSLALVKTASEGAATGHADLIDTTKLLVSLTKSGAVGVGQFGQAMGMVNAIVGAGDMTMQDLEDAFKSGIVPVAETAKLKLTDVGAALAYLADRGIPADRAAHMLIQTIGLMENQSVKGSKELAGIGMTATQMALDLQKPNGLLVAMQDLHEHLKNLSTVEQNQVLGNVFGGARSSPAVKMLLNDLDDLGVKYKMVDKGASDFQANWEATTKTAVFQAKSMHAAVNGVTTAIGMALLPAVQRFAEMMLPVIDRAASWIEKHKQLSAIVLASIGAFGALIAVISLLGLAFIALDMAATPMLLLVVAIAAVAAVFAAAAYAPERLQEMLEKLGVSAGTAKRVVDDLRTAMHDFGTDAVAVFTVLRPLIMDTLQVITDQIRLVGDLIHGRWGQLWGDVQRIASDALKAIVKFFQIQGDELRDHLGTLWNRIISNALMYWTDFKGWLGTIWADIVQEAVSSWQNLVDWFDGLPGRILNALGDAGSWLLQIGEDALTGLWNGMKSVWNTVIGWLGQLGSAAVGAVVNAAKWLYGIGQDAITGMWNGIKDVWSDVAGWLASMGGRVVNSVVNAAKWLYSTGGDAMTGMWNGIKDIWNDVAGWLASTGGRVTNAVVNALKWLYNIGQDAFTGLWNGMKFLWDTVSGWLGSTGGRVTNAVVNAAKWLYGTGEDALTGLWDGMKAVWATAAKWLGTIDTLTVKAVGTATKWLSQTGKDVVTGFWDGAKDIWGKAETWFGDFDGMIDQYFKGADTWLYDIGIAIIQGIWDGMKNKWNDVAGWLGGLGDKIGNLKGPIDKDRILLVPQGQAIIQGLQSGMQQRVPSMLSMVGQIAPQISAQMPFSTGAAAGGGGGTMAIQIDLRGAVVASDQALQQLTDKIGRSIATKILPSAGVQIRR